MLDLAYGISLASGHQTAPDNRHVSAGETYVRLRPRDRFSTELMLLATTISAGLLSAIQ